jgi:hypothetical protein
MLEFSGTGRAVGAREVRRLLSTGFPLSSKQPRGYFRFGTPSDGGTANAPSPLFSCLETLPWGATQYRDDTSKPEKRLGVPDEYFLPDRRVRRPLAKQVALLYRQINALRWSDPIHHGRAA